MTQCLLKNAWNKRLKNSGKKTKKKSSNFHGKSPKLGLK